MRGMQKKTLKLVPLNSRLQTFGAQACQQSRPHPPFWSPNADGALPSSLIRNKDTAETWLQEEEALQVPRTWQ